MLKTFPMKQFRACLILSVFLVPFQSFADCSSFNGEYQGEEAGNKITLNENWFELVAGRTKISGILSSSKVESEEIDTFKASEFKHAFCSGKYLYIPYVENIYGVQVNKWIELTLWETEGQKSIFGYIINSLYNFKKTSKKFSSLDDLKKDLNFKQDLSYKNEGKNKQFALAPGFPQQNLVQSLGFVNSVVHQASLIQPCITPLFLEPTSLSENVRMEAIVSDKYPTHVTLIKYPSRPAFDPKELARQAKRAQEAEKAKKEAEKDKKAEEVKQAKRIAWEEKKKHLQLELDRRTATHQVALEKFEAVRINEQLAEKDQTAKQVKKAPKKKEQEASFQAQSGMRAEFLNRHPHLQAEFEASRPGDPGGGKKMKRDLPPGSN